MEPQNLSIEQFVTDQINKWKLRRQTKEEQLEKFSFRVITICTQPGSGGRTISRMLHEQISYDLFDKDIIQKISKSANMSTQVINTLEKERLTGVEDFISSLVKERYFYPGDYLRHLMKVLGTIARHGRAVIVGRGANFILPQEQRLSIYVTAPLETRVKNVAYEYKTTLEEARKRVVTRESRRRAFVRESFHADISDPLNYDLIINTDQLSLDAAVKAIIATIKIPPT
jgi:cytidylate kinase